MVIPSPPQTYLGLMSVTAMFQKERALVWLTCYLKGKTDILDDNVLCAADDAQTLTLDHTLAALTEEGLVRVDGDTELTGVVTVTG